MAEAWARHLHSHQVQAYSAKYTLIPGVLGLTLAKATPRFH